MLSMPSATTPPGGESARGAAASARDAGVHRVRRLTRWTTTGALALTGAFAGLAAHATAHAKHRTPARAAAPPPSAPQTSTEPYGGGGSSDSGTYGGDGYGNAYGDGGAAPQAPAQAPQQTYSPPAASTGAS
jgi:hypothetical protein